MNTYSKQKTIIKFKTYRIRGKFMSEFNESNTQSPPKTLDFKKILPVILTLIVMFNVFRSCGGLFSGGPSDKKYIDCAKQIMSKSMKNPDSLSVNEAYVYEKDDYGSAIVYLDFTGQNSFGGTDRNKVYVCVQHLDNKGNFTYNKTNSYVEVDSGALSNDTLLELLKDFNNWGEPKS